MKFLIFLGWYVFAANVDVKGVDAGEDTTIHIQKGAKPVSAQYEIVQDTDDLAGEPAALLANARKNWDKACQKWKEELKELNKDNQVLSMNCGTSTCTTAAMESTCTSKAKYKLKVKVQ